MQQLKILSIDGGGTRGIIPATILHRIYEDTGKHPVEFQNYIPSAVIKKNKNGDWGNPSMGKIPSRYANSDKCAGFRLLCKSAFRKGSI